MTSRPQIPGRRIRVPKWIHGRQPGGCVVKVEAEAVIPDADPSEPCLESKSLRWSGTARSSSAAVISPTPLEEGRAARFARWTARTKPPGRS
jgi:hypothetical protein